MKRELRESFDHAARLLDAGDLRSAKNILLDLSTQDPNSPAVLAVLGDVYWKAGKLEEAVITFRRATQLRPALEAVSLGLFHCLWELGRHEDALEEVKRFQSISDSEDYRSIVKAINEQESDKLKDITKAQQKVRLGKTAGKIIDRTTKSEQNAKKFLRDAANDPSCADDL